MKPTQIEETKNLIISNCENCPFLNSDYDGYAIGYSVMDKCQLSLYFKNKEYIIAMYDEIGKDMKLKIPKWCPLRDKKLIIELKNAKK